MSFQRYERYKESGVEWLGEVPEGWEVLPLKRSFNIVGGSTPKSDQEAYWDGEIVWVTPSDLSKLQSLYISDSQRKITDNGLASCGASLVPVNSIILSTRAPIGSLAITDTEMCTNQGCKSLVPNNAADAKFYGYLLSNSSTELNIRGKGTTFLELSGDELGAFKVPFPPLPEQLTIAAFLDCETGKIDALVAEQERLIALLKEKRQASISHAVTKGLNPAAPMKNSGIEWLGEVPEAWEVLPLKRDLEFLTSGSRGWAEHYADDGALFIRIGNLTRDSIRLDLSDIQRVAVPDGTEGERTKVQPGDVLFSITAYLGSIAIVPENLEPAYVSQHVALARLGKQYLLPEWVGYVALSYVGKTYLETQGYGGTKIQLSLDDVANLVMTQPAIKEQSAIVDFLDSETAKIDTLVGEAQQAIGLLKERRSALISAAVTGKIDVRG